MYDINALSQRIDAVNKQITAVNIERNRNIGKREALERQYEALTAEYKEKYGVSLTAENLAAEVKAVTEEKNAEVEKIEKALQCISAGQFDEAEFILTGKHTEVEKNVGINGEAVVAQSEPAQPKVLDTPITAETGVSENVTVASTATQSFETVEPAVSAPPFVGVAREESVTPPSFAEPTPPVSTPPVATPPVATPPVSTPPSSVPNTASAVSEDIPVAPPVFGKESPMGAMAGFTKPAQGVPLTMPSTDEVAPPTPPTGSKPTSFGAIFGGTAFLGK